MNIQKLGSVNLLWFLISLFLSVWLGIQLFNAVATQEILDLRGTNIVPLEERPIWFVFVFGFKLVAWLGSVLVVGFFIKTKISGKQSRA